MLRAMERPPSAHSAGRSGGATKSAEPSDADLVLAVAQRRDVAAFEQLYQRYERPAYNLARYLTVSSAAAEEAVQEAMMRVWRSASNFRPDGRFKGWFLAIVADCSMELVRRKSREQARVERHARNQPRDAAEDPGDDMERHELNGALHRQMEQLDPLDRRLLALYYGADMTQKEIGRVLDVPQTTVSMKLRDALAKLRTGLTAAGFAAAVPMLETGQLGDALLGGAQAPAVLHGKILKGLSSVARHSARTGAAASKGAAGVWAAVTVCAAVAAGGAAWWAADRESVPAPVDGSAQGPAAAASFYKHWDFNSPGEQEDFTVTEGAWQWVEGKGSDGSACMETTAPKFVASFKLPPGVTQPLVFEFEAIPLSNGGALGPAAAVSIVRSDGAACLFDNLGDPPPKGAKWRRYSQYLKDGWWDGWVEGKHISLIAYDGVHLDELAVVTRGQFRIDSLTVRSAKPEEVPDTAMFQKALAAIPLEKRVARVPLAGLPQAFPDRPVEAVFFRLAEPGKKAFLKVWDFNVAEPYPEFQTVAGKVLWLNAGGPDGSGSIETTEDLTAIYFELPKDAVLPLEIAFRATALEPPKKDVVAAAVGFTEFGAWSAAFRNLPMAELPHGEAAWCSFRTVLTERFSDGWVEGKRYGLYAYDKARAGKVGLVLKGRMRLDDLSVRNLAPEDVPDVSAYAAAIDRIPPEKRTGTVPAPELGAGTQGRSPLIAFVVSGAQRAPYHQVWDLTKEGLPEKDFKMGNLWHHVPCGDGGMCLQSEDEKNGLSFRLEKLNVPVRLRVEARPLPVPASSEVFVYPRYLATKHAAFFHNVGGPAPRFAQGEWFRYEFILHGDLVEHRINGTRILATWLDPEPGSPMWLIFDGPHQMRRIEIEEMRVEDLPDVTPLRKALQAIPGGKRLGRVDLPAGEGIPSGAYLEFDPKRLMEQIQIGGRAQP